MSPFVKALTHQIHHRHSAVKKSVPTVNTKINISTPMTEESMTAGVIAHFFDTPNLLWSNRRSAFIPIGSRILPINRNTPRIKSVPCITLGPIQNERGPVYKHPAIYRNNVPAAVRMLAITVTIFAAVLSFIKYPPWQAYFSSTTVTPASPSP